MSELKGDPRFKALLDQMWEIHCKKSHDYGDDEDYLANLRASEDYGIPAWKGGLVRLNDKVIRTKSFCKKGVLKNEPFEDALLDMSAYALLVLILYREAREKMG